MANFLDNMRPVQSRLLVEIADSGQLQRAAQACAMTQPAASRMLADIEDRLGTVLFERLPKGMEPTPAGALIVHHARRILDDHAQLCAEFRELGEGRGGTVRVGAVTGPAIGELVPAIHWLKARAPRVDVTVEVAPSQALVQALGRGDLDFALARLPAGFDDRGFEIEPARDEIVRLMVRDGHPMLGQGPVSLRALSDFPWILQERGLPIRRALESVFHDEGLASPGNVISASSLLVIVALLRDSDAIAPMSQEVMELMLDPPVSAGFRRLDLNRLVTVEPYMILRPRERRMSHAAEMLLDRVRTAIRGM